MNNLSASIRAALLLILFFGSASALIWKTASIPAQAAIPTPTEPDPFAVVRITKPTFTPSPTPIPTVTDLPTLTPVPVVMAEIVADDSGAISYTGPNPPSPENLPAYTGNKYILVDISEQHMYVYEGDALVYSFIASTGMNNATRVGTFSVLDKIPNAYGSTWDIWMPNWLGIYYSGTLENGIHALPILPNGATLWEGYLGTPVSFGCVVLGTFDSQVLYDWAEIGTPVEIQW